MLISPFDCLDSKRHSLVYRMVSILIRPLVCARCEAILSMPSKRFAERARVVKQKTHHDGRKHQCFTPRMESMLTEAEYYCEKLSMAIVLAKCCDNCPNYPPADCTKQKNNNLTTLQTCSNRSTCIYVHYGIQILPQGQRGVLIVQHASTSFEDKPHRATQQQTHTQTNKEWSGGWSGQNRNYWKNPACLCNFQKKVLNST